MIALEWHVGNLRLRGLAFDELDAADQLAVLTHYYKRGAGFDATTLDPLTGRDVVAVASRLLAPKRAADANAEGIERLQRLARGD